MNKQALAFLTMFSLILMLSVYYVTLPNDNMSVMTQDGKAQSEAMMEEENKEENKENTKETEEKNTDEVLALQEEIEKKEDGEIHKQETIVSKDNTSSEDKQNAVAKMESIKDAKELQKKIVEALKQQNIKSAVEITDKNCIINVFNMENNMENAKKAMNAAYSITKDAYFIEVVFKDA
ncbi:stage III sporulation protein AH [Amedibacterium intestinale]|uniref:stage III sporulation protein AH n=1 Tax=Amedibacterium intestinale TaxID=2583452 RepID=UPI000E49E87C|nr:stage III sporulation protein AH [Amedibacterium intestinale]RHO34336.1 stage III sporulation protein AH [Erysipelotrichaceae bacterium AM17-60]